MTDFPEAEAFAALHRVAGHATAMTSVLLEVASALEATGRVDVQGQVEKLSELHRLACARLAGILRLLGEGAGR